jgi:hypothetical protein
LALHKCEKTAVHILKKTRNVMLECNIDARGKAARLMGGLASVALGLILAALLVTETTSIEYGWYAVIGALLGGAFAIFEARAGWCVIRAMGFKTPL